MSRKGRRVRSSAHCDSPSTNSAVRAHWFFGALGPRTQKSVRFTLKKTPLEHAPRLAAQHGQPGIRVADPLSPDREAAVTAEPIAPVIPSARPGRQRQGRLRATPRLYHMPDITEIGVFRTHFYCLGIKGAARNLTASRLRQSAGPASDLPGFFVRLRVPFEQRLKRGFDLRDPLLNLSQLGADTPGRGRPRRQTSHVKPGQQVDIGLLPGLESGQDALLLGLQLCGFPLSVCQLSGEFITPGQLASERISGSGYVRDQPPVVRRDQRRLLLSEF